MGGPLITDARVIAARIAFNDPDPTRPDPTTTTVPPAGTEPKEPT